jgi:predicted Zn-dependent peptidase
MDRTSDLRGEQATVHSASGLTRRAALKAAVLGGLGMQVPTAAQALIAQPTLRLSNGLRIHLSHNRSGYVSAALVLRSREIAEPRGLAHIMEHTSFTGAAGSLTAREVKALHSDCIQDSNATTGRGMIEWNATFLPKYTSQVLDLLAITSLDQRFDVETVASEARVVLQELFLDKYDAKGRAKKQFEAALYGPSHPYAHDTTETEIAAARTPPPRLAAELAQYAQRLKLPANMDLFLVGEFDPGSIGEMVRKSFGRFAFAEGARLDMPQVGVTRSHVALSGVSKEMQRPMSEMRIAWNTGVGVTDRHARTLMALGEYLNKVLFSELREKSGDSYTPEASFTTDSCSGVFEIRIASSNNPEGVERRIFDALGTLRDALDPTELRRFSDRLELKRRQGAQSNAELLECMVERTVHGASSHDFEVRGITVDDIRAAARDYLPTHKGAYVRLTLLGQ